MEELRFIAMTCCIFVALLCVIGVTQAIIEQIKLAKLKKKWAAEQERAKISRYIKLGCCKKCPNKANGIDYFGTPCIYNSEWSCEGPSTPEHPITIEVKRAQDWAMVTRCKDCIHWENKYCNNLKINVANRDWFCCSGMRKKGDK